MKTRYPMMTGRIDGDFVVFLIGARVNRPWKPHKWVPVFLAMRRMLSELTRNPADGLLGYQAFPGIIVQYWRSFDHLERFAAAGTHRSAWTDFYRRGGIRTGDVGIWHETYKIRDRQYETLYGNMPRFGLGKAGTHATVSQANATARQRLTA